MASAALPSGRRGPCQTSLTSCKPSTPELPIGLTPMGLSQSCRLSNPHSHHALVCRNRCQQKHQTLSKLSLALSPPNPAEPRTVAERNRKWQGKALRSELYHEASRWCQSTPATPRPLHRNQRCLPSTIATTLTVGTPRCLCCLWQWWHRKVSPNFQGQRLEPAVIRESVDKAWPRRAP